MPKHWKYWPYDQCDVCGDAVEVYADTRFAENEVCDDDTARCLGCRADGGVRVEEDGDVWINWD